MNGINGFGSIFGRHMASDGTYQIGWWNDDMKHGYATFKSPLHGMKEGLWDSNVLKNLEEIQSYDP